MYTNNNQNVIHSIFGKRPKVIKYNEDVMKAIVECPNCKSHVEYGTELYMVSGISYCDECEIDVRAERLMNR